MKKQKTIIIMLLFITSLFTGIYAVSERSNCSESNFSISSMDLSEMNFDDFDLDIDDDEMIITPFRSRGNYLKITDEYELYVNDDLIETTPEQKKFLKKYYKLAVSIQDKAYDIGMKGAKIGVKGAKLGAQAISGVLKMIFTSYDSDDLEDDMERKAEILEEEAEELEEEAEELETKADKLEDYYYKIKRVIPDLKSYRWI